MAELKRVENAAKMLQSLRQQYWSGQAYDLMFDELFSILVIKFFSEKSSQDFNPSSFAALKEEAEKLYHMTLKVGPQDAKLNAVIDTLSQYQVRGNVEISHQMHQALLKKTHRKDLGQYFTPPFIRRFMLSVYKPDLADVICDPAAGSGAFLIEAANSMDRLLKSSNFIYYDVDRLGAIPTAQKAFLMYEHPSGPNVSLCDVELNACDSLACDWRVEPDRIYTNVPFGLTVSDPEILKKFEVGRNKKRQNTQLLFIEKCLKSLKQGGTFATVVDRGVTTNLGLRSERTALSKMAHLELVVDLPGQAFEYFAGTTFGTCLLFFRKVQVRKGSSFTKFAKVVNLGYDERGYLQSHDDSASRSFDPLNADASWDKSDFKAILDGLEDLDEVDSFDVIETGDWQFGSYKYRGLKGDKIRDLVTLSNTSWDGKNQLNPTVNRKLKAVEETHLRPQKKTNQLVSGSLLFSRLLSDNQDPVCGLVHGKWIGAGVTSENYLMVPNSEEALVRVWHAINFNQSTKDYLKDLARGQGRGRIKEDDLLNAPIPEVGCAPKVVAMLELLREKSDFDDRVHEKLRKLGM